MFRDAKYGLVLVENPPTWRTEDDEPVFLLRAQDVLSMRLLEEYKSDAADHRADSKHIYSLNDVLLAFRLFQEDHPELVKVPD